MDSFPQMKTTTLQKPNTIICQYMGKHIGIEKQRHTDTEDLTTFKPTRGLQGPGYRPRASKGRRTEAGNGGRRRHMAWGVETSGGG